MGKFLFYYMCTVCCTRRTYCACWIMVWPAQRAYVRVLAKCEHSRAYEFRAANVYERRDGNVPFHLNRVCGFTRNKFLFLQQKCLKWKFGFFFFLK